ncbi:MAG TPA: malto-oligosyltrehalose synthase [Terriglobales bacterium]|nr:malto-oligosyltrehalose synthase [Terriglobales bacterium]
MTTKFPLSTYRLQFNREFTFRDAARLVPYLASLGITHCYASPYLRARPGSTHGYDIIDHNSLNPEIGSPEDYEGFVAELHRHGMGQVLDLVPNHMGVMGSDNAWWLDVLENGEASTYAEFFDIDWDPIKEELQGKVLIPILDDQYGSVLERGELKLVFDAERGEFSIFYYEHRFPINPREYPRILGFRIELLEERLGPIHDDILELQSIKTAFGHLPTRQELTAEKMAERNREKEVQKRRLAALCARAPEITQFLLDNVVSLNGTVGDPRSFDALHELIKAQAYRLAQWRVAADDINYRRFFDINDLAALRMENEVVFQATHRLILELVAQGKVNGLRIDHPDGLYDPAKYFRDLQCRIASPDSPVNREDKPGYVFVEKILTGSERLRKEWPVHGTTGYEFANLVNGLFIDQTAATRVERIYRSFVGEPVELNKLVYDCKKLILKVALASELNVLANLLSRIALSNRRTCDFTLNSLRSALAEIIACFPVYRTYVTENEVSSEDQKYMEQGIAAGRKKSNAADLSVFDFIRRILLVEANGEEPQWYRRAIVRFAMKFQQVTSAVMAKGLEDTAFYRYNRLVSLNEVGGDPGRFGVSVEEFHRANQKRLQCWPHSMLATSTHDSKRSEDVRARINVLSEIPAVWRLSLRRWRDANRSRKHWVDGKPAPYRNDEYLLYQTLVGAWPAEPLDAEGWQKFAERIEQYMLKAGREGKEHTSWANPNTEYEAAVSHFVRAVLDRRRKNRFLGDFVEFHARISRVGMFNSLSQILLKLASPGVPDVYQGNELWEYSLVDPDNRRAVDYGRRQKALQELRTSAQEAAEDLVSFASELLDHMEDDRIKLYVTWKGMCFRKQHAELFQSGAYIPLSVRGQRADHVCAFARERERVVAMVAVPRLCATLLADRKDRPTGQEVWGDTRIELPPEIRRASYRSVFTGEEIAAEQNGEGLSLMLSSLLGKFPVGLVYSE